MHISIKKCNIIQILALGRIENFPNGKMNKAHECLLLDGYGNNDRLDCLPWPSKAC